MRTASILGQIERFAWLRMFDDGLWDIALGVLFVLFGLSIVFASWEAMSVACPVGAATGTPLFVALKRRIAGPRLGLVRFHPQRERRARRSTSLLLAGLVLVGGACSVLWGLPPETSGAIQWIRQHFGAVLGLIFGGALALAGWAIHVNRFIAYGLLLFAVLLGAEFVAGLSLGHGFVGAGGAMILCGTAFLVRFLRRYPPLSTSPQGELRA